MIFNTSYGKVNIEQKYLDLFKSVMQYDLTDTEVMGMLDMHTEKMMMKILINI